MSPSNSDPPQPVPEVDEVEIFSSIPWCQTLLSDPTLAAEPTISRFHKPSTREDALLGHTLKTDDAIAGWVSLYRRPTAGRPLKDEVCVLLSLQPGLNGYPGVCHGGVVATLLDEVLSVLVVEYRRSGVLPVDNVTAYLHVSYVKPVPTPAVVAVRGRIREVKGRKHFADGEVVSERGVVLAKAEGLFVSVQREKL